MSLLATLTEAFRARATQDRSRGTSGIESRKVRIRSPKPCLVLDGQLGRRPWDAHFVNVAQPAGLRSPVIYGSPDHNDYVVESMGCGAAFLDYDNDGWQDIVLLTGRRLASTPAAPSSASIATIATAPSPTSPRSPAWGSSVWATGITVADYDNDGFDDLFITCWGQNLLFHNNGDGTFTDVTAKAGLLHTGNRYATGCTWIDYDRDGSLDLFVSHYLVFDQEKVAAARQGSRLHAISACPSTADRPGCRRRAAVSTTTTAMALSPT